MTAIIKGEECPIEAEQIRYKGEWYGIQEDQEGDFYIIVYGTIIYLTILN